ncbi:hypothetical protein HELRODRAFT_69374, partial [Helobdella robusta]|uniref:Sulfotransferase domain-containing protein n=1 Tax=Helobdella robusta TaxID=6412 RepID=T1FZU2_HELRO
LKKRFPHCLIIGTRKSGTRALLEFLSLHPSVVAAKKETHFFDSDENFRKGLKWYLNFMPPSTENQITVEKTPAYFFSGKVPARIKRTEVEANGSGGRMKFLLIVKDPVERALSDYAKVLQSKQKQNIRYPTFEELSTDPITDEITSAYRPIRRSLYNLQLRNWLKHFKRSQLQVVDGAALVTNPVHELQKVEKFLGLQKFLTSDKFIWSQDRGFYFANVTKIRTKCLSTSKGLAHPRLSDRFTEKIRNFFRPFNEDFYNLTRMNFDW